MTKVRQFLRFFQLQLIFESVGCIDEGDRRNENSISILNKVFFCHFGGARLEFDEHFNGRGAISIVQIFFGQEAIGNG